MAEPTRERVLVCGLGHVGYRVARLLLRLGVPVAVIGRDMRSEWTRALAAAGAEVAVGDARDDAVLGQAGIAQASTLIGAADADLENLEVALDARRTRPDLRLVLRIFDRDLARSLEQSFGDTRALGASALAAPVMAHAALGKAVIGVARLGQRTLFVLSPDTAASPLAGASPRELSERFGVAVLGSGPRAMVLGEHSALAAAGLVDPPPVRRREARSNTLGAMLASAWANSPRPLRTIFFVLLALSALSALVFRLAFDPPIGVVEALYYTVTTVTTTGYGDITPRSSGPWMMIYASLFMLLGSVTMAVLYSFATSYVVSEQLRTELGRPPMPDRAHVIVVGIGNVGYRTWDELEQSGYDVVAVDNDPNGEFFNVLRARAPCALGDARLTTTLSAAGVERARAVIAATGDDAANLAVALTARRLAPDLRTAVRVFDADFAQKLETSNLVDVAISTSRVAAPTFAAAALFDDVAGAFVDSDGLTALCWRALPPEWMGKSPRDLGKELPFVEHEGKLEAWDVEQPLPEATRVLVVERRPMAHSKR